MRATWLIAGSLLCGAVSALAQASAEWSGRETALWQAVKDHKMEVFSAGLDPTFVGIYPDGLHSRATEVAQARPANLKDFQLSQFTIRSLGPQVVLLTYKAVVSGKSGGKDFSGTYWVGSLWQMRGKQWRTLMHTEVKGS